LHLAALMGNGEVSPPSTSNRTASHAPQEHKAGMTIVRRRGDAADRSSRSGTFDRSSGPPARSGHAPANPEIRWRRPGGSQRCMQAQKVLLTNRMSCRREPPRLQRLHRYTGGKRDVIDDFLRHIEFSNRYPRCPPPALVDQRGFFRTVPHLQAWTLLRRVLVRRS